MQKYFDGWNETKKEIHKEAVHKFYHPRDIWWCVLGHNVGFEQDGTGSWFARPVLVLKGFSKKVCLVVPLTTSLKKGNFYVSVGEVEGKNAVAIISQIRLVDTKRFTKRIKRLEKDKFEEVKTAVKDEL